jgi:tRNA(Ile2) C34 agmatinyltransferase TiaS
MTHIGPTLCDVCGERPASKTKHGMRCHLCMCRDICTEHPVPLPHNPKMRRDLQSIGIIMTDECCDNSSNAQERT